MVATHVKTYDRTSRREGRFIDQINVIFDIMEGARPSGTGFILKEEFKSHVLAFGHPERPERLIEIQKEMKQSGLEKEVESITPVSEENEILKVIVSISSLKMVLFLM